LAECAYQATDLAAAEAAVDHAVEGTAMAADTSSAPAGSTPNVGPAAKVLASLIIEPIPAKSVAAEAKYSGAAIK